MVDFVCTGCSLLCDDSTIDLKEGLLHSLGLCRLGHTHLETALRHIEVKAHIRKNDRLEEVSINEAIAAAAQFLNDSDSPLLVGWSQTSNEVIKEGLGLTADVRGFFDSTISMGISQALRHEIHSLKLDTTLEHIRNYGDFIIYWGVDPIQNLHRHPSRFAALPRGEKIPEGFESRTIAVVDVRQTETMKIANFRIIIPVGSDSTLIEALTSDISGESKISGDILGIPAIEALSFSQKFQKSDCTAIFYGSGILNTGNSEKNLTAFNRLVKAVREKGKEIFILPMFTEPNGMGIIKEVSSATSVPCSIDYSSGTGIYESTMTALQKLVKGEFSTSLVVGDDVLAMIPGPAARALANTNLIYLGSSNSICHKFADVFIQVPDSLFESGNTMERMDMVSVKLKNPPVGDDVEFTMFDVIKKLRDAVKKGSGSK